MSDNEEKSTDPLLALSPCPCFFCGCAKVVTLHEDRHNIAVVCNVGAGGCGARGPYESSVSAAIASWNSRTPNAHSDEAEAAAIELLRHRLCNDEDGWRALLTLLDALTYRKEMHRAANARGDGAWISVNDRLPELSGMIIMFDSICGHARLIEYDTDSEAASFWPTHGFTHWQPLPPTPGSEVES